MEQAKDIAKGIGIGLAFGAIGTMAKRKAESNIGRALPYRATTAIRGLSLASLIYGVAGYPKAQNKMLPVAIGGIGLGLGMTALPDKVIDRMPMLGNVIPTGPDAIDMEIYDIPDWMGRNYGYERISHLLKKFVLEDTKNRKTGEIIPAGYKHPSVVWLTRNILANAGVSVYDPIAVANVISNWCFENLTYVFDPMTTEAEDYFVHPYLLIKDYTSSGFAAGDCDDFATLVAAMLLSVGLTPRFLLWAQNADAPEAYTHITTALYLPEHRYPDLKNTFDGYPYYNIEATMKVDSMDYSTAGMPGATPGGLNYHPRTFKRGVIVITE